MGSLCVGEEWEGLCIGGGWEGLWGEERCGEIVGERKGVGGGDGGVGGWEG